jgi:hypothetical protein
MKIDFAFLCDYAEATVKINALGIGFDRLIASQIPTRHPHFSFVIQLRATLVETGEKTIEVHLIDDDGKNVIPPLKGKFAIPKPAEGELESIGRVVMQFGNVEFPKYGSYSVRAVIEGIEMVNIGFKVIPTPQKHP